MTVFPTFLPARLDLAASVSRIALTVTVWVVDRAFTRQVGDAFREDVATCREVTREVPLEVGRPRRLRRQAAESFCNPL